MKGMLALAFAVSILTSTASPTPVSDSPLHLSDAVDRSTFIAIGRVEYDRSVDLPKGWIDDPPNAAPVTMRFGRIAIERVMKGDPATLVVYHEDWSPAKATSHNMGQRCLLFLGPGVTSRATPAAREILTRTFGDTPIFSSVGTGQGIVRIFTPPDEVECVEFVRAPDAYRVEGNKYLVRLQPVLDHIETQGRFALDRVAIHATSPTADTAPRTAFDFRVLTGGTVRLETGSAGGELIRVTELGPARWEELRSSIQKLLGLGSLSIGEPYIWQQFRRLRVALPGTELDFVDNGNVLELRMDDAALARYRLAVRTWALVREAIDCPECVDHRPADKEWLER